MFDPGIEKILYLIREQLDASDNVSDICCWFVVLANLNTVFANKNRARISP
jgi:hypothetical protein